MLTGTGSGFGAERQLQNTGFGLLLPSAALDALAGVMLAARQQPNGPHTAIATNVSWQSISNQVNTYPH